MSNTIVKGLKIDTYNNIVKIKACSSNLSPKTFYWEEYPYLTDVLREEGKAEVEKIILYNYWTSEFVPGTRNKYSRAVAYFKTTDEGKKYKYTNIGDVLDKDVYEGPLDKLPLLLSKASYKQAEIIKERLQGRTFKRTDYHNKVICTRDAFKDLLYKYFKAYSKREKEEYVIAVGGGRFLYRMYDRMLSQTIYTVKDPRRAKRLDSLEEAIVFRDALDMYTPVGQKRAPEIIKLDELIERA